MAGNQPARVSALVRELRNHGFRVEKSDVLLGVWLIHADRAGISGLNGPMVQRSPKMEPGSQERLHDGVLVSKSGEGSPHESCQTEEKSPPTLKAPPIS